MLSPALAALHDLLVTSAASGGAGARNREFNACALRVMARVRTEFEVAPVVGALQTDRWQKLAKTASGSDAPDVMTAAEAVRQAAAHGIGGSETPAAQPWFDEAVAALSDYIEAIETALPTATAVAVEAAKDADGIRATLSAYLASRFPGLPQDAITTLEIIPGGRAKETSRFRLIPNAVLPERLILRRDFDRDTTGTRSSAEFPLLRAVHDAGIPVPRPILTEDDPAILGGSFVIVEEVVGAAQMGDLFPELNDFTDIAPAFGDALADAVARLHAITDPALVADMGGHHSAATPHDAVRGFYQMWQSIPAPPFALATELGFAWLLGTPLPEARPRGIVHGDLGAHNFMTRDGNLAAILDWELAHLGDAAEDIGYLRATIIDPLIGWERFAARYIAAGGSPAACDAQATDWFSIWAHVRNSVYVAMFRNWVMTGERSDIESVNAGWDFFARTQRYIVRELARATAA